LAARQATRRGSGDLREGRDNGVRAMPAVPVAATGEPRIARHIVPATAATQAANEGKPMNWIIRPARWLYALFYTYVGASWFSYRLFGTSWPEHQETPAAKALTTALTDSGIVDPLIASVCLVGGACLFFRRTAPLGIAILAPLVTGIFIFHAFLNQNLGWGAFHLGYLLVLAWCHRSAFRPLWRHGRPGT